MESLIHLDKKMKSSLTDLAAEIASFSGDNLVSVYLYGSAVGKKFAPGIDNLNTLILLNKIDIDAMKGIARIYRKAAKERVVAPLVLTPEYVRSSTDTFPIEFLDIKENSALIIGKDIMKDVVIGLAHLREQCEREIKGQLVRMRGIFLEVEGDRKGMEKLVVNAVSNLIFPLKNILRLLEQTIPGEGEDIIKKACLKLEVVDSALLEAWGMKKEAGKASLDELYSVLAGYISAIEEIAGKIDVMILEGRL